MAEDMPRGLPATAGQQMCQQAVPRILGVSVGEGVGRASRPQPRLGARRTQAPTGASWSTFTADTRRCCHGAEARPRACQYFVALANGNWAAPPAGLDRMVAAEFKTDFIHSAEPRRRMEVCQALRRHDDVHAHDR